MIVKVYLITNHTSMYGKDISGVIPKNLGNPIKILLEY